MPCLTLKLLPRGALIELRIAIPSALREVLVAEKQPTPEPRLVRGLIDTGASQTCIDRRILNELGIQPSGTVEMVTPSTGSGHVSVSLFNASISLLGNSPAEGSLTFPSCSVAETEVFEQQNYHALIGRDLLSRCLFVYNGKDKSFTLAY